MDNESHRLEIIDREYKEGRWKKLDAVSPSLYYFVVEACVTLKDSRCFAEDYTRLKMEFFRLFQKELVFSTRFGANFFEECRYYLECECYENLKPDLAGGILGEFDKNFNRWLDMVRP